MRRPRGIALGVAAALALAPYPSRLAAVTTPDVYPSRGALRLYHQRATCFPGDGNPRVVARVESLAPVVSALVFFRSKTEKWEREREERFKKRGLEKYEHYQEMRAGGNGIIWMVLPIPDLVTEEAVYRIVVRDAAGNEASTEDVTVPVTRDCESPELTAEEQYQANNLVVGQTGDAQDEIPRGWRCRGIVSEIEKDGVLKPTGCANPALWWGGAILAGSGVAVVTGQQNPVSPTRPQPQTAPRGGP